MKRTTIKLAYDKENDTHPWTANAIINGRRWSAEGFTAEEATVGLISLLKENRKI